MCCKINNITHINIINTNNRLYMLGKSIITILILSTFTPTPMHHITISFSAYWGSISSQCQLHYFALLLKLKDTHSAEFLAFIQPVVIQQWSFPPILSPWNVRFSLLLVPLLLSTSTTTTCTSTRGIQLCIQPATQLMHPPLLLANRVCQSTACTNI